MEDKNPKNTIIEFPDLKKRQDRMKEKERAEKQDEKSRQERDRAQEFYRTQDRILRAKEMTERARLSANGGKQNFINWDRIPEFTRIIIGVLLAVQIILSLLVDTGQRMEIFYYFGFVPAFYVGGVEWSWSALAAPITTLFIHTGWMHLSFNIVMMLAMGVFFERNFGMRTTAKFFIFCGLAGNLAYFVFNPFSTMPVIGASGAISGLFGASMLIMQKSGMSGIQLRSPIHFILIWTAVIVGFGLLMRDVSWQSHLGGFYGGLGLYYLWTRGKIRL